MQIRLFAPSCGGIMRVYFFSVIMSLIVASKGGCEKKINYGGGTHEVNGEFSGPDYTHTIYLIFSSFFIFFLRFSLPIFHHFRLQPLAKAFSFRDHWSGSNGDINTCTTNIISKGSYFTNLLHIKKNTGHSMIMLVIVKKGNKI